MKPVAIGLSILLLAGFISYAQDIPMMIEHKEREMKCCPGKRCAEIEGLSPEQRTKIEDINTETRRIIIPLKSQIELKEIDLQKEMKAEKPNRDKILKIAQEIHELKWQIKKAHLEEQIKINSILTPEQREKMRMMQKHKMIKKVEIEGEK